MQNISDNPEQAKHLLKLMQEHNPSPMCIDLFPDMHCFQKGYRVKRVTVLWSAARNKERFSSRW